MKKTNNISFDRMPVETESIDDYTKPLPFPTTGPTYAKITQHYIPEGFLNIIRELIQNQNEIIDKLESILNSRIGKSILNLEEGMKKEDSKL